MRAIAYSESSEGDTVATIISGLRRIQCILGVGTRAAWSGRLVAKGLAFAALALLLSAASVHSYAGNSDGATVILEGRSMSAGHLTLSGWSMTVESFWTIDAVFYAVAVRFAGLRPALLHVVPALIATLIVLVGAQLAARDRRGRPAVIGAVTVVALVGLPAPSLAYYLL